MLTLTRSINRQTKHPVPQTVSIYQDARQEDIPLNLSRKHIIISCRYERVSEKNVYFHENRGGNHIFGFLPFLAHHNLKKNLSVFNKILVMYDLHIDGWSPFRMSVAVYLHVLLFGLASIITLMKYVHN